MADVIQVARKLAQRLRSFRRYRRISLNMDLRFPDATDEEIDENEHCVICRDSLFDGSKPKKLPCGHIFHIDCLRSWLVMQQVCPTCRAEIPADGPLLQEAATLAAVAAAAAAAAEAPRPEVPQQQPAAVAATTPAAPSVSVPAASASAAAPGPAAAASAAAPGPAAAQTATQGAAQSSSFPVKPSATVSSFTSPGTVAAAAAAAAAAGRPAPCGHSPSSGHTHHAPVNGPAAMLSATAGGSLPPLEDIMDSLKRAEEVAKFLKEQQDFWMEQVRQIQQRQAASSLGPAASFLGASSSSLGGDAGLRHRNVSSNGAEGTMPASPTGATDQMAELRRARQEAWEKKRTESQSAMATGDAAQEFQ
eukprot:TRINITY_DN2532_c0_g1_i1.p1 TRINITY_DN2532_c0_g1~~TRINITY_DN2532_c0_g1_i1.p1  ORF type:complete len:395 (+),score=115.47 TRINITY_DN2532_c0_g1_i1:98-1186(+)